jgi:hypothetical protein
MKDLSKYYTKSEINKELVPDPQDPNAIEETAKILDFIDTALHRILIIDRGLLETGLLKNQELRKRVISGIESAVAGWKKVDESSFSLMKSIHKTPENNKEDIETAERTLGSFLDYFENIENDDDDAENPDEFDK